MDSGPGSSLVPIEAEPGSVPKVVIANPPFSGALFPSPQPPTHAFFWDIYLGRKLIPRNLDREPGPRPIPTGGNVAGRPRPWLEGPLNRGPGHDYPVFRGRGNGFELLSN